MIATVAKKYTPEDLLAMPDDGKCYELVNGELVEKAVSMESDVIGGILYHLMASYCDRNPVGQAFPETYYQCFPDDPSKVRRPDASFISAERVPRILPRGHCQIAPDLAAEVISPNDLYEEVEAKVEEYLRARVRLVWVLNPRNRSVRVHRIDGTTTDIGPDGELSGEDVLPDFRCPVAALFPASAPPTQVNGQG